MDKQRRQGSQNNGLIDRDGRPVLSSRVADTLREEIFNGDLPAGTRIVQDEVRKRFNVSRTPARDALRQLMHEGLLSVEGRGLVVISLGGSNYTESASLLAVLHGWAAGQLARRVTPQQFESLAKFYEIEHSAEPHSDEATAAHLAFHRLINLFCDSEPLLDLMRVLTRSMPKVTRARFRNTNIIPEEADLRLLVALRKGDSGAAEEIARKFTLDAAMAMIWAADAPSAGRLNISGM
jgi:DNA-binding GntR family transcriptional regulator